jgi:hypothetical protein
LPALLAFRALSVAAFAAGFAAIAAAIVSRALANNETFAWVGSLTGFGLKFGLVGLAASVGTFFVMPRRTDLLRSVRGQEDPPLGTPLILLLVALAAIAMMQVPSTLAWAREELSILRSGLGLGSDPLGLNVVPMTIVLFLPALAALTVVLYIITSLLGIVAPSKLAGRVLGSGVLVQLGYVAAGLIVIQEMRAIGTALTPLLADDPTATREVSEWIARHDAAASATSRRLAWTCLGYVIAAVTAYTSRAADRADAVPTTTIEPSPVRSVAVQTVSHTAVLAVSSAAVEFNESSYSVHPRMTLIESWFTRTCTHFEIRTIPHRTRNWFSFSWDTGVLRHEPSGAELLRLRPAKPPGLFLNHTYEVVDPGSGQTIAKFIPRGSDWEIEDACGNIAGRVLRHANAFGPLKYRAFVGDAEVCQFKWALAGLSVSSAQLEIVFLDRASAAPGLDRGIIVSISPILEQQARIANEPRN